MEINNTIKAGLAATSLSTLKNDSREDSESNKLNNEFTAKEKSEIVHLEKEDKRVRTHENAHKAAAGNLSKGSPNYNFKLGPDGKRYAVSGDVHIDSSEVRDDPEATIKKAQKIRKAALAPADPSAQDLKVARDASNMEIKAKQELAEKKQNNNNDKANSFQQRVKASYDKDPAQLKSLIDFSF